MVLLLLSIITIIIIVLFRRLRKDSTSGSVRNDVSSLHEVLNRLDFTSCCIKCNMAEFVSLLNMLCVIFAYLQQSSA